VATNFLGTVVGCLMSGGCSTPFDPDSNEEAAEFDDESDFDMMGSKGPLLRPTRGTSDPSRPARIGRRWAAKDIRDEACRQGCERVAAQIQKLIGGEIKTIVPRSPNVALGAYRKKNWEWHLHVVVVKAGRVYDAFTGHRGLPIDEFKALWQYSDAIDFGF